MIAIVVIAVVAALGWVAFTQLRARRLGVSFPLQQLHIFLQRRETEAKQSFPALSAPSLLLGLAYTCLITHDLQLPPPSFSSYIPFKKSNDSPFDSRASQGGVVGWVNDRVRGFKQRNNRTARGAYEPSGGNAARGNHGGLDPDEAWDSRVHDEYGYYEEQELGNTSYRGGGGVAGNTNRLGDELGGSGYEMNLPRTPAARSPAPQEERRGRQPAERNPFDDDAEPSNISVRKISPRPLDTGAGRAGGRKEDDSPTDRRSMFREEV